MNFCHEKKPEHQESFDFTDDHERSSRPSTPSPSTMMAGRAGQLDDPVAELVALYTSDPHAYSLTLGSLQAQIGNHGVEALHEQVLAHQPDGVGGLAEQPLSAIAKPELLGLDFCSPPEQLSRAGLVSRSETAEGEAIKEEEGAKESASELPEISFAGEFTEAGSDLYWGSVTLQQDGRKVWGYFVHDLSAEWGGAKITGRITNGDADEGVVSCQFSKKHNGVLDQGTVVISREKPDGPLKLRWSSHNGHESSVTLQAQSEALTVSSSLTIGPTPVAEHRRAHTELLLAGLDPADQVPAKVLVYHLRQAQGGAYESIYLSYARDGQGANGFYAHLQKQGMNHSEASAEATLAWWATIAGCDTKAILALMGAYLASPEEIQGQLRALLTSAMSQEGKHKQIKKMADLALDPERDIREALLEVDWSALLIKTPPPSGEVRTLSQMRGLIDYWQVALKNYGVATRRLSGLMSNTNTEALYQVTFGKFQRKTTDAVYSGTHTILTRLGIDTAILDPAHPSHKIAEDLLGVWIPGLYQHVDAINGCLNAFYQAAVSEDAGGGALMVEERDNARQVIGSLNRKIIKGYDQTNKIATEGRLVAAAAISVDALKTRVEQDDRSPFELLLDMGLDACRSFFEGLSSDDWLEIFEVAIEIAAIMGTGGAAIVAKVLLWLNNLNKHGKPMLDGLKNFEALLGSMTGDAVKNLIATFKLDSVLDVLVGAFFGENPLSTLAGSVEPVVERASSKEGKGIKGHGGIGAFVKKTSQNLQGLIGKVAGGVVFLSGQAEIFDLTTFSWFRTLAAATARAQAVEGYGSLDEAVTDLSDAVTSIFSSTTDQIKEITTALTDSELGSKLTEGLSTKMADWVLHLLVTRPPSAILRVAFRALDETLDGGLLEVIKTKVPGGGEIASAVENAVNALPITGSIKATIEELGQQFTSIGANLEGELGTAKTIVTGHLKDGQSFAQGFIHRSSDSTGAMAVDAASEASMKASQGAPLAQNVRKEMEGAFGADFSAVRVHTDSHAVKASKGLRAHAMADGANIYFNKGKYDPSSTAGKKLLAHELTHVVQTGDAPTKQGADKLAPKVRFKRMTSAANDSTEVQADRVGAKVAAGESVGHEFSGSARSASMTRRSTDRFQIGFKDGMHSFGEVIEEWQDLLDEVLPRKGSAFDPVKFVDAFAKRPGHTQALLLPLLNDPESMTKSLISQVKEDIFDAKNLKRLAEIKSRLQPPPKRSPRNPDQVEMSKLAFDSLMYLYAVVSLTVYAQRNQNLSAIAPADAARLQEALEKCDSWAKNSWTNWKGRKRLPVILTPKRARLELTLDRAHDHSFQGIFGATKGEISRASGLDGVALLNAFREDYIEATKPGTTPQRKKDATRRRERVVPQIIALLNTTLSKEARAAWLLDVVKAREVYEKRKRLEDALGVLHAARGSHDAYEQIKHLLSQRDFQAIQSEAGEGGVGILIVFHQRNQSLKSPPPALGEVIDRLMIRSRIGICDESVVAQWPQNIASVYQKYRTQDKMTLPQLKTLLDDTMDSDEPAQTLPKGTAVVALDNANGWRAAQTDAYLEDSGEKLIRLVFNMGGKNQLYPVSAFGQRWKLDTGVTVDPVITRLNKNNVLRFLVEISSHGKSETLGDTLTRKEFYDLWSVTSNREHIREAFLKVNNPKPSVEGSKVHEWIPRENIDKMVQHASADANSGAKSSAQKISCAAQWIYAQHFFRSVTRSIVFHPEKAKGMGYFLDKFYFEAILDSHKIPKSGAKLTEVQGPIGELHSKNNFLLSGHPGALFGGESVQATKGSLTWHARLWKACEASFKMGESLDLDALVENLINFVTGTLWNGDTKNLPEHIHRSDEVMKGLEVFSVGEKSGALQSFEAIAALYKKTYKKLKDDFEAAQINVQNI